MKKYSDAFGHALWDAFREGSAIHSIEREDGYLDSCDAIAYLRPPGKWTKTEHAALRLARGRVLDVGCGAGRHTLALQARGLEVLGIDASPLAVKTARARGLKRARVMRIEEASARLGRFDTILMGGNNFGLFGSFAKARRLLRRFQGMTAAGARIIVESNDVYATKNPVHLEYQRRNRARGRMSGQIRFRVRYNQYATGYYDYLMVSPAEMREIAAGTGWHVARVLPSKGSTYFAVLEKDGADGN